MSRRMLRNFGAVAILFVLLLIFAIYMAAAPKLWAWTILDSGGLDVMEPGATAPGDVNEKLALRQGWMSWRNKSGSSMAAYDPVIVDGASIAVVTDATAADDMTIANDLSSEDGPYYPMVVSSANQGSSKTCAITGTDENGAAQAETVTFTATGVIKKSAKIWKTITDFDAANLSGNVQVYSYCANGVLAATADTTAWIGHTTESIADNAEGEVATRGWIGFAPVRGAAIIPGDILSCAGSGYLDEDSTAPAAVALEPSISTGADELVRVLWMDAND